MGKTNKSIGTRMRGYEHVTRTHLPHRIPAIIRVDGKAFHSFTKGLRKPFDDFFRNIMQLTMQYMCENVQGCVFGYTQSDEISLLLTDYETIATDAWFDYTIQKMCSVAASMATLAFNKFWAEEFQAQIEHWEREDDGTMDEETEKWVWEYLVNTIQPKLFTAMFDARTFSIPKDEVCNYFIWRQQDATRNSIETVGQTYFSQKDLNGRFQNEIQEMLWQQHSINWNTYPIAYKRGVCCSKVLRETPMENPRNPGKEIVVARRKWVIDREPPIFTQDREYVEKKI